MRNDIIEAANNFIQNERERQNIDKKGHFVLNVMTESKLGNYRLYVYEVYFVDNNLKPNYVSGINKVLQVKDNNNEPNYKNMDISLLEMMFDLFSDNNKLSHFISGDYGTIR